MRQMQVVEAERCCSDVPPSDSTRRPANSERFAVFFARGSGSELAYMQHTSNQQQLQRRRPRDIGPNCSLRGALRALRGALRALRSQNRSYSTSKGSRTHRPARAKIHLY